MYALILNPFSGNGKGKKYLPKIEEFLKSSGIEYKVCLTSNPHDAFVHAESAVRDNLEGVIIVGGDGSVSEVLGGLHGSHLPVIFVPCGTGNDFLKTLKLPKNPVKALKKQFHSPIRKIDSGIVNETPFINVAGAGFDADVLKKVEKYKSSYRGLITYLLALFDALGGYKPFECEISIDGGPFEKHCLTILSIGNGRYYGGGMKAVPGASLDDGLFNLVLIRAIKKRWIPFLLPIFILGLHTYLPISKSYAVKRAVIRAKSMTFQLDGELIDIDSADISVLPASVTARF